MSEAFNLKLMKNEVLSDEAKEALQLEISQSPGRKYGPLTRFLSRFRISYRIYALVLLSLLMLAGITTVQHLSEKTIKESEVAADQLSLVAKAIKNAELMITRMEVADIGFSSDPEKAEATFTEAQSQAIKHAKEAQSKTQSYTDQINKLTSGIHQLNKLFSASKAARMEIGLNDKEGLRGVLSESSSVIDNELTQWPNVSDFQSIMTKIHRYEQSFLITRSKKDAGRIRKSLNEFDFAISGGPFGLETRKKLSTAVREYGKAVRKYVKAVKVRTDTENAFTEQLHNSRQIAQQLTTSAERDLAISQAHGRDIRAKTTKWQTIIMATGAIIFALFAFIIADSIHKPVSNIRSAMNKIAEGDASIRIPGLSRQDEIGAMARSIAVFKRTAQEVERIREQEQKNKEAAERNRRETLTQLADNFENTVRKVAESVHASAKDIASNAKTLSRDTRSTQEQGEDMSRSIGAAADIMGRVVASSDELLQAVASVDNSLTESSQSINRATEGAKAITDRVQSLSDAANGIGNVVTLINEIAEKTNLLALNATIEAARAGDAGKGFAVVAGEVKQLAQQTQNATSNIGEQVKLIQGDIAETVNSISAVCQDIEDVNALTLNLNEAVRQQTNASRDIKVQVSNAALGTDQVSTSLGSMKNAIETSSASANGVVQTVSELSRQTEQLEQELNAFIRNIHAL